MEKKWVKKGIYHIQDILNENGKFLTYVECKCGYSLQVNFLHYFQILASIPIGLRPKPASEPGPAESSLKDDAEMMLCFTSLMTNQSCFQECEDYYLLFLEKNRNNSYSRKHVVQARGPQPNVDIKSNGKICLKIYRGYLLTTN